MVGEKLKYNTARSRGERNSTRNYGEFYYLKPDEVTFKVNNSQRLDYTFVTFGRKTKQKEQQCGKTWNTSGEVRKTKIRAHNSEGWKAQTRQETEENGNKNDDLEYQRKRRR